MLVGRMQYWSNTCCILGEDITGNMIQFADPIHSETIRVTINDPRLIGPNRKKRDTLALFLFFLGILHGIYKMSLHLLNSIWNPETIIYSLL